MSKSLLTQPYYNQSEILENNQNKTPISDFEAIIFDFDGTLAKSFPLFLTIFTEELNERSFIVKQDSIERLTKEIFVEEISNGNERLEPKVLLLKVFYKTCRKLGLTRRSGILRTLYSAYKIRKNYQNIELFTGAPFLLEELYNQGIPLILITHSKRDNILKILRREGLDQYFNIILDRKNIGADKTAGIVKALEAYGIDPKNAIAIGDLPADIVEAKAAGVKTVAITGGLVNKQIMETKNPDYTIENVYQLKYILNSIKLNTFLEKKEKIHA